METCNVCFKKFICVKINLKNLTHKKDLSIRFLAIHCLQMVHLMQQKIRLIVKKANIAWKSLVKTYESTQQEY